MPIATNALGMDHGNPSFLRDPASPAPGGRRLGSIELQEVLSRTGHAVLYRAWDHGLGRPAIVEEYFPAALARRTSDGRVRPADPTAAERFEQGRAWFVGAWRVLAQCDHPSLVRVLLLLEAHGTAYAVMPAQAGEPLAAQTSLFPLDEPALRGLIEDLLGALEAYHGTGHAHGDLRPGTVRWQPGGRALLVSPGAARPVEAGGAAAALKADLQALALLARFCVTGIETPPVPAGAPEPLGTGMERLGFDVAAAQYSPCLVRLLQSAAEPDASRRPGTPREWRVLLATGAPPDAPVAPPVSAPAAAAPAAGPAAASAAAPAAAPVAAPVAASVAAPRVDPDMAPAAASRPPPAPRKTTAPAAAPPVAASRPGGIDPTLDPASFDPETAAHIQRVLDSFAESGDGPRHARRGPPLRGAAPAGPVPAYEPLETGPRRWPVWLGLAAVALVFGIGVWQVDYRPPEGVRITGSRPPSDSPPPVAPPPTPGTAPIGEAGVAGTTPAPPPAAPLPAPPPAAQAQAPDFTEAAPPPNTERPERTAPAAQAPPPAAAPPAPPPPAPRATARSAPPRQARAAAPPAGPRTQCGDRTQFALYRCMQQVCSAARWRAHPQCARLRETDAVD